MQNQVAHFLETTGMHYRTIDPLAQCKLFVDEMERGLRGEDSSLMMLPTYLQTSQPVPQDKRIVVMDAGGTNFRVATVVFTPEGPSIANFKKYPMPGAQGTVGREEFFGTIADRLQPVHAVSDTVGFCFSYPTEIQPNRDGRMLYFSKEVQVDDVEGRLVGEEMNRALTKRGLAPKRFVLLNDTAATLLGGMSVAKNRVFDSHIGYILGTGVNTCYLEPCANILKTPQAAAMAGSMVVNIETGGYLHMPQGKVDRQVDAATADPGRFLLEKMMSGQYLGHVIFRTVCLAAETGLFSPTFVGRLQAMEPFSLSQVDQFCYFPYGDNALALLGDKQDADILTLYELIDAIFERVALLTAINLGAVLLHTGTGKNPTRPVCVTAEGTTFYKSKLLHSKLEYYVRTFINDTLGAFLEFQQVDDVTLLGTAAAGLLEG